MENNFSLQQVSDLYTALATALVDLEEAQAVAKAKKDCYDRIAQDLADMLTSVGMTEMRMTDGKVVKLKTDYFCSAAQDRMPAILDYLNATGQRSLPKI